MMKSKLLFAFMALCLSGGAVAQESVSVTLPAHPTREQVMRLATEVRPSYRQLDYQQREMLGFIHIGMNTFTGAEWGTGKEAPSLFNPSRLDAEEWVKTFKAAGITGVILVAKHHDGFCTWPSRYTDHSVAHSPWRGGKGDLVKEVADACRKLDMKLCIYLSPWDMHEKTFGTPAYNDYYIHQLEELLTRYGPVYLLWFDGAGTTSDVSGHEMPFAWERIFRRARELQPDVILSGNAPDVRWVGNEKGKGRETEWCVQGVNDMEPLFGALTGYEATLPELGSIDDLMTKKRLVWYPSRGGLPLRKGWFYNSRDDDTVKSLNYLVNSYFVTVGQNSNLLPNLSPDPSGRFPEKDAQRLIRFGEIIRRMKATDYAKGATAIPLGGWAGKTDSAVMTDNDPFTSWHTADGITSASLELRLKQPARVNVIKLQENVRDFGQRVERFAVDVMTASGWKEIARSTTIGYRKMLRLKEPVCAGKFRIRILDARVSVSLGNVSMYYLEEIPAEDEQVSAKSMVSKSNITIFADGSDYILKLNTEHILNGLFYLPEEGIGKYIEKYAVYLSSDGKHWGSPVATGRFGNIVNNPVEQYVPFETAKARYVKLKVLKTTSGTKLPAIPRLELAGEPVGK